MPKFVARSAAVAGTAVAAFMLAAPGAQADPLVQGPAVPVVQLPGIGLQLGAGFWSTELWAGTVSASATSEPGKTAITAANFLGPGCAVGFYARGVHVDFVNLSTGKSGSVFQAFLNYPVNCDPAAPTVIETGSGPITFSARPAGSLPAIPGIGVFVAP